MTLVAAQPRPSRVKPIVWPFFLVPWTWAIWSCAEHWRGNPNYSYGWVVPLLVIGFAVRRFLRLESGEIAGAGMNESASRTARIGFVLIAGLAAFGLEFARDQMWHQEIVLWTICLMAVAFTLVVLRSWGGDRLMRAELFPVLFFLTAVPWPPRFEQPIVSHLMTWVAMTTTELLHWFGIEAQTSGAAIALPVGLVGISEACSGVRSLQAGIMFGLAMGEWFLLRPIRRIILLVAAVVLALATNLGRTLALALYAEQHGVDSLGRVHDLIGNVMITTLIVAIWLGGRLLSRSRRQGPSFFSIHQIAERFNGLTNRLSISSAGVFGALMVSLLIGIIAARSTYGWIEAREGTLTRPLFHAKIDNSNQLRRIPVEIWNELRPTSGEQVHRQSGDVPGGAADCFHFFWKPSRWNRFALVHRPDICMPGVGWQQIGAIEPTDIALDRGVVRCYLFRFRRGDSYALELWGVWRNGKTVPVDYNVTQVLGVSAASTSLNLQGKGRSATEIIACSVIASRESPPPQIAVALLRSVFDYTP